MNVIRVPELKLAAIVLSNNEAVPPTVMSSAIVGIYFGQPVTLAVARPVVTLDPAIYDRYAGQYQLPSGALLTISNAGSTFFAEAPGPGQLERIPESAPKFDSDTPEATITFTVVNGTVTQLVLNVGGRDRPAKRVQ